MFGFSPVSKRHRGLFYFILASPFGEVSRRDGEGLIVL